MKIGCSKGSHVILSGISVSLHVEFLLLKKKSMFLHWHKMFFCKGFLGWIWII